MQTARRMQAMKMDENNAHPRPRTLTDGWITSARAKFDSSKISSLKNMTMCFDFDFVSAKFASYLISCLYISTNIQILLYGPTQQYQYHHPRFHPYLVFESREGDS